MLFRSVAIIDRAGDILAIRSYRKDYDQSALDNYRIGVIAAKEIASPAVLVDGTSFLHYLENEIYYVGITKKNANAGVIFEFLSKLPSIFKAVFGIKENLGINEIKKNAQDIIELLDEMVDSGYPQTTDPETLRLFTQRQPMNKSAGKADNQVTIMATGAISWRQPNLVYKKNELFVDIVEKVSVLVSPSGKILDASVNGNIIMKDYLSGMPECKIGFNDKVTIESDSNRNVSNAKTSSIEVDDMVFHQCVKLTNFANDRAISFTPPDGEFELMRYRKTENIGIPFTITPMVHDLPGNKLVIRVNVRSTYDAKLSATPLILSIPLPDNTSKTEITTTTGRAKYVSKQNAVAWKIANFPGNTQADISITVSCLAATSKASPATKIQSPISAEFNLSMFSASGLSLRYLQVVEKSGYVPEKWLRYSTKAGKYEVRMV